MLGLMQLKEVISVIVSRQEIEARNRYPIIGGGTYGTRGTGWTGVP